MKSVRWGKPVCVCGCGESAVQRHHVVYQQDLRAAAVRLEATTRELLRDERNLVPVANLCHGRHHSGLRRFPLEVLPDAVFEFAVEVLGAGKAFNYLERRYAGGDPRLDALLEVAA